MEGSVGINLEFVHSIELDKLSDSFFKTFQKTESF